MKSLQCFTFNNDWAIHIDPRDKALPYLGAREKGGPPLLKGGLLKGQPSEKQNTEEEYSMSLQGPG